MYSTWFLTYCLEWFTWHLHPKWKSWQRQRI